MATGASLAAHRADETRRAAEILGVERLEFLGYEDSGMLGDPANSAPGAFWASDAEEVAARLARILVEEEADSVVVYDERGIYGHPDHVKVHQVGVLAASQAGLPRLYEVTVDREYLHFVESHLVTETGPGPVAPGVSPESLGLVASPVGVPTVLVTTTVDVRGVLERKRQAMAVHASQIPESASAMRLPAASFADVYGYEWYVRNGPPGPLEGL